MPNLVGTVVQYDDVKLLNVLTNDFQQESFRTQDDADVMFHKFTISVTGICYGSAFEAAPTIVGASAKNKTGKTGVETFQKIMATLSTDRKAFTYTMDGKDLLDVPVGKDANNGPKVKSVRFVNVARTTIRVYITFEVCVLICCDGSFLGEACKGVRVGPKVLSNRWATISEIDDEWRETRTVQGQLRVFANEATSDGAAGSSGPNVHRSLVVPPLQNNFDRIRSNFEQSSDGLTLQYSIVDRSRWAGPPAPGVKWRMQHIERTGEFAITQFSEIYVSLTGPPNVDKRFLMGTACAVAFNKLDMQANTSSENLKLITSVFTDHGHAGTVELMIVVQRYPTSNAFFTSNFARFGSTLSIAGYDPAKSPVPSVNGIFGLVGIFAAYLQNPCADPHNYPKANPTRAGDTVPSRGNDTSSAYNGGATQTLPTYTPLLSAAQATAIYTEYAIDSKYPTDARRVGLPIAGGKPTDPSTISIALARGGQRRVVVVEAKRVGSWPALPRPADYTVDASQNIYAKIDNFTPVLCAPELSGDGQSYVYTARGQYEYTLSHIIPESLPLMSGALPWSTATLIQTAFSQAANYQTGIIQ